MNFLRHTTSMPPPPATDQLTRADYFELMRRLLCIEQRCVRIESKVMRLMEHHGLNGHGQPLNTEESHA